MTNPLSKLSDIHGRYDVVLCDVWGVLHNGVDASPDACTALAEARTAGMAVVLITNSPRPFRQVVAQLDGLGVPREAYDRIVTSGDVTRTLVAEGPEKIFFLGLERDLPLVDGLGRTVVDEDEAEAVVCTGLYDDENDEPESYRPMLTAFRARDLPFICANPDIVVERGDRLVPCAGALAAIYDDLGGETRVSGKPHRPIYEAAMAHAGDMKGRVDQSRVLAIGDGMPTDVKGALDFGLDLVYVAGGIHVRDYLRDGVIEETRLKDFLAERDARPKFWMTRLV